MGQSGHNLRISPYRRGAPRFAPDPEGSAPGEVTTYRLEPGEVDRLYGPPPSRVISREELAELRRQGMGCKEIARRAGLEPEAVEALAWRYGLGGRPPEAIAKAYYFIAPNGETVRKRGLEGEEDMNEQETRAEREKQDTAGEPAQLTREKLIELKKSGLTDFQIRQMYGMSNATFYRLKEQWDLLGFRVDALRTGGAGMEEEEQPAENGELHRDHPDCRSENREECREEDWKGGDDCREASRDGCRCSELAQQIEELKKGVEEILLDVAADNAKCLKRIRELEHRLAKLASRHYRHRHQVGNGFYSGKAEV